jgi:hypothetical protein
MSNFIKKAILCIVLILPLIVLAQVNYETGYVILKDGDTLLGSIDNRDTDKNPGYIDFKAEGKDPVRYYPDMIRGFSIAGNIFSSAIVDLETSPDKMELIDFDPSLKIMKDTVFLKTIIQGEKSLYMFKGNDGRSQFFILQGGSYDLLKYKRYYGYANNDPSLSKVLLKNKTYIGQLVIYLDGCEGMQDKLYQLEYDMRSLRKVFDYYYTCRSLVKSYEVKGEHAKVEYTLLVGASATFIKFTSSDFDYLVYGDFSPSIWPSVGFAFDVVLPKNLGKLSIDNEVVLTGFHIDGYYKANMLTYGTATSTEIMAVYQKINNMVRYKFPVGNAKIFVNAGLSNGFMIAYKNEMTEEKWLYTSTDTTVTTEAAITEMKFYELGVVGGVGARWKKLSAEVRFEWSTGFTKSVFLGSYEKRLYFFLGYRF